MNGFASVVIAGNLVRDPEMKYLPSGTPLCEFGIAVNEKRNSKETGEKIEEVSYFDVTCFGKTAEVASQWLTKGKPVAIEGKLQQQRWEKDGQKRSKIVVIANRVHFLPSKQDQGNEPTE